MVGVWTFLRPDSRTVLLDKNTRVSLARYFDVMQNEKPAKFMIARKLAAGFKRDESTRKLWKLHDSLLNKFVRFEKQLDSRLKSLEDLETPSQSFLDLKIELASRILENCHFCTRRCGANRRGGSLGYCRCGTETTVSSIFEHIGEEPELVPSGTVFTLGCTMRCLHCQNWAISQWGEQGEVYSVESLAKAVEHLRSNGCRNANLVGGDPTPWLAQWLEVFKHVGVNVPVIWNSNSYYSEETAKLLAEFADVYLLDFKYGNNACAERISDAANYWEACTRSHLWGKGYGELIIRVLVLPRHLDCCVKPVLEWIAKELGVLTRTNVMFQYRPEWRAHEIPELRRRLTEAEKEKAVELARRARLANFLT